jgi:hypothetical protein
VTAIAVGEGLDQGRLAVLARQPNVLGDDLADREHIHPVDAHAGDAHALGLVGEVGHRGVPFERGSHPVEVVLNQEDHRQAPKSRQIHRLAEVAGVGGAVTEHADGHLVGAAVIGGEGQAGSQRQVAADDSVAAHEAVLEVEDVH